MDLRFGSARRATSQQLVAHALGQAPATAREPPQGEGGLRLSRRLATRVRLRRRVGSPARRARASAAAAPLWLPGSKVVRWTALRSQGRRSGPSRNLRAGLSFHRHPRRSTSFQPGPCRRRSSRLPPYRHPLRRRRRAPRSRLMAAAAQGLPGAVIQGEPEVQALGSGALRWVGATRFARPLGPIPRSRRRCRQRLRSGQRTRRGETQPSPSRSRSRRLSGQFAVTVVPGTQPRPTRYLDRYTVYAERRRRT